MRHPIQCAMMQQKNYANSSQQQMLSGQSGMHVRTGLRAGACVDVNEQVKAALQTLTDALGGTLTVTATPATAVASS